MKLAVISDIHANLPALEAVLRDAAAFDALVCCGDLVGYYADPNEVCERVRNLSIPTVRGNHDAFVIGELSSDAQRDHLYRTTWTRSELRCENFKWLQTLPTEIKFQWASCTVVMRHASPWDETSYLYPDSQQLQAIRLDAREILVVGHTHRAFTFRAHHGLVVNPGAVGQPRGGETMATYAVINLHTLAVEHRRVPYDLQKYQERLRASGWDEQIVSLLSGRRSA